ncbi:MAG: hypothetical protein R3194_10500, partial [Limnobacter sp.]|nr:hypothetical protein [Limnobacter sp.]
MRTDGPTDLNKPTATTVSNVQSLTVARVAGAQSASFTDPNLNQRMQGRALSGQFLGMDANGLAKLKVGNAVLRLLLPIGTKAPPQGAPLVVNIVGEDGLLKTRPQREPLAELSAEEFKLKARQSGEEFKLDLSLQQKMTQRQAEQTGQSSGNALTAAGKLLAQVLQHFSPREGARLLLFASQAGLLPDATKSHFSTHASGSSQRMTPLLDVLGLKGTSASEFSAKTSEFAAQLQGAIKHSGLFYESHLAQWRMGKLSTQELGLNPQGDWGKAASLGLEKPDALSAEQSKAASLANQQLNLLQNPRLNLIMPGLFGEQIELAIYKDQEDEPQS